MQIVSMCIKSFRCHSTVSYFCIGGLFRCTKKSALNKSQKHLPPSNVAYDGEDVIIKKNIIIITIIVII